MYNKCYAVFYYRMFCFTGFYQCNLLSSLFGFINIVLNNTRDRQHIQQNIVLFIVELMRKRDGMSTPLLIFILMLIHKRLPNDYNVQTGF